MSYSAADFGINVVSSSGYEQICKCPFHSDMHASSSFNTSTGLFYCFVCEVGYNAHQLSERLLGLPLEEVEEAFEREFDPGILFAEPEQPYIAESFLPNAGTSSKQIEYCASRGFNVTSFIAKGLANHVKSIVSPVDGIGFMQINDGKEVGVQIRNITGDGPRYMFRGQRLPYWPFTRMLDVKSPTLFVEGNFSALRLRTVLTHVNVFSTQGSTFHKDFLKMAPRDAVFVMDNDYAGIVAAKKLKAIGFARTFVASKPIDDMKWHEAATWWLKVNDRITL